MTGVDAAANSATANGTVMIDGSAPTAVSVQTTNAPGGVAGEAGTGDSITWTYSGADPARVAAR